MKYDVAVIGSGPAGSYCATTLASRGFKVLLIDKEKFPRQKVCGGLLSAKALKLMEDDDISKYLSKTDINPVNKIVLKCGKKVITSKRDIYLGLVVKRKQFDNALVNIAIDKGANFIDQCKYIYHDDFQRSYKIYTTKGIFFSNYIVGADGVYSEVAKISKIRHNFFNWEMGFAASCEVPKDLISDENGIEFVFSKILGGMGWCFTGKDYVNLGVGGYAPASKMIFESAKQLIFEKLRSKNLSFKPKGYFLPAGGRKRQIAIDRIFLVGDAAGFVDPFSGEGIYYALKSGQIAANVIEKNQTAKNYENKCYEMFLDEFRFSAFLSIVLGDRSKILNMGIDEDLLEAFLRIFTVPPQNGCYKSFVFRIIKYGISPTFPYLWMRSLLFA